MFAVVFGVLFSMSLLNSISWSSCYRCCCSIFFFFHLFKSFSVGCSFDWRALPLSVSNSVCVCMCVCVLFFMSTDTSDCVIGVSSVFYYYHIMSSSIVCVYAYVWQSLENSLAMRLVQFADKHKITQCLLSIKWNDCKAKRASSFSLGWITIHPSIRFAYDSFFLSLFLFFCALIPAGPSESNSISI